MHSTNYNIFQYKHHKVNIVNSQSKQSFGINARYLWLRTAVLTVLIHLKQFLNNFKSF